jgi:uncharacterized protein YneF (UPF0154 family)
MMSMHSLMFLMIALILLIVLVGGVYVTVRVVGARAVEGDHPDR